MVHNLGIFTLITLLNMYFYAIEISIFILCVSQSSPEKPKENQNYIYIYIIYMCVYVGMHVCMYIGTERDTEGARQTEKERLISRNRLMWGLSSLKSKG